MHTTKLQTLRDAAQAGDWQRAVAIAARFPQLGPDRAAILDAHTAYTNARFLRQLGKDPAQAMERGRLALCRRYSLDAA